MAAGRIHWAGLAAQAWATVAARQIKRTSFIARETVAGRAAWEGASASVLALPGAGLDAGSAGRRALQRALGVRAEDLGEEGVSASFGGIKGSRSKDN